MREEEENKNGFTVVDKRGQNNPIQEKPVVRVNDEDLPVQDRRWKSVGYLVLPLPPGPDGQIHFVGQAAGLGSDGNTFVANWTFGMRWERGFDWTIDATRRLDSFLQCACTSHVRCGYHRRMCPNGWLKEDMDRIREDGNRPVPEVIEILFKAERARRQAQVVMARPR
jgi:hypothetical protein